MKVGDNFIFGSVPCILVALYGETAVIGYAYKKKGAYDYADYQSIHRDNPSLIPAPKLQLSKGYTFPKVK
jgi:hypothetical protein